MRAPSAQPSPPAGIPARPAVARQQCDAAQAASSVLHVLMMQSTSAPQSKIAKTAQFMNWSMKNCASEQACAAQFATHTRLKLGGKPPRSMQPSAHSTAPKQSTTGQVPQSTAQLVQLSYDSHLPLPHTEQTPQSCAHDAQVSVPAHEPSPQLGQAPQSLGQVKQFSLGAWQGPSPHDGHAPQSGAHDRQSSGAVQKPSPHGAQTPQSPGQLAQLSLGPQSPSPQPGQSPQSVGQLEQLSVAGAQVSSPQEAHAPQSCGQLPHVSPLSQSPFGQLAHTPQSCGQLPHVSPSPQLASPQPAQKPQSGAQVAHDSLPLHWASPHTAKRSSLSSGSPTGVRAPHEDPTTTAIAKVPTPTSLAMLRDHMPTAYAHAPSARRPAASRASADR